MYRILVADSVNPVGLDLLRESGAVVHELTDDERPRLVELVADVDALVVRSATRVTRELLEAGKKLKVVGRAGIGVDNVDVAAATEMGILVVNAPTANVLSATEHTFAMILALARKVSSADAALKDGRWDRKAFVGTELQGKTLGVVGFGRIGRRVAARGRAFEMEVLAYDPYLDAAVAEREEVEMVTLEDLLRRADVVTLHTPLTDATRGLINAERLALMKPEARLINCGRGGTVDEAALLAVLESGHLAGAALDVFSVEPPEDFELAQHPRVVATPHIGASTREAQERIATETARMLLAALAGSLAVTAVNLPFRAAGGHGEPYLSLAERLGRLAAEVLGGTLREVKIDFWGIDESLRRPLGVAALKGALGPSLGEAVNYVNAEHLAKGRSIELVRSVHSGDAEYPHLLAVTLQGSEGSLEVAGTLFGDRDARVVRFRGMPLEFQPEGKIMMLRNRDVPGVVGKLGTYLGSAGINIADIHLARQEDQEDAVAALRLDQLPSKEILEGLRSVEEVLEVRVLDFGGL